MKLVEFLQGKWLSHPLHPAIVHVPVGAWTIACALDVITWFNGNQFLMGMAFWCVGFGLAGALLAVPPGVADWSAIKKEKPAWKLGLYHMVLNLVAALVWAANLGLRYTEVSRAKDVVPETTVAVLGTSVVGTVLLLVSAYLGTLMVSDHGIGVARTSKKKWRKIAQRGGAHVPEET